MIWHFAEVWLLLVLAFAVGGALGAILYDFLARSRLATAQGAVADAVGDVIDAVKARLGVGPVWRPEYRRVAGRAVLAPDGELDLPAFELTPVPENVQPAAAIAGPRSAENAGAPAGPPIDAGSLPQIATEDSRESADGNIVAAPAPADAILPMRPAGLSGPRNGVPDNLQRIRGVGERNEALLNSLGIFHFGQIAAWTPGEVKWVGAYLAFPERIERDDWVGQATILASGGDTGFVKAADRRRARRQEQLEEETGDELPVEDREPDEG